MVDMKGKVPNDLLKLLLGDEKTIDSGGGQKMTKKGKPAKGRQIQKRTLMMRSRKDPGPRRNPRGNPQANSLEDQLMMGVGELPDVNNRVLQSMGEAPTASVEPNQADVMLEEAMGVPAGIGPQTPYVQAGTYAPADNAAVNAVDGPPAANLAKSRISEPVDDNYGGPKANMGDDYMDPAPGANYAGTTGELTPEQQMAANQMFIDKYGHEPGGDGEIVEAEQMFLQSLQEQPVGPSPEDEILKKIMGQ